MKQEQRGRVRVAADDIFLLTHGVNALMTIHFEIENVTINDQELIFTGTSPVFDMFDIGTIYPEYTLTFFKDQPGAVVVRRIT